MKTTVHNDECNHGHYDEFRGAVARTFYDNLAKGPVFRTNADGLNDAYLEGFDDPNERQHHNCHACRTFIERFGGLAMVDGNGRLQSAVWNEAEVPAEYQASVAAMSKLVRKAKIVGIFMSSEETWGIPVTGAWSHLHVVPPSSAIYRGKALEANQMSAARTVEYASLMQILNEYTVPMLEQAVALLRSDALYRSEKVLGQAEWLYKLKVSRDAVKGQARANVVWLAVATAPQGFCHPKASMIGTLLDDIAAGMDYEQVSRRFAKKMHPLQYQRPQSAPDEATIKQAEALFEKMGAAKSLERRYARIEEVEALWKPIAPVDPVKDESRGVFAGIIPKGQVEVKRMVLPSKVITFEKFMQTVLPGAERIEVKAPYNGPYISLLTAVHHDAPPIIQWDSLECRNPVSWYYYNGGASATRYNLESGKYYTVTAISRMPFEWNNGSYSHYPKGYILFIDGARDKTTTAGNAHSALFPEIIRSEYHGVRSVIEAYSQLHSPAGIEDATAAGLAYQSSPVDCYVRVYTGGHFQDYHIDRME